MKYFGKALLTFLGSAILCTMSYAQPVSSQKKSFNPDERPKLVVGIIVDQMRYDYITRFWDKYGNRGFKRMINQGYNFANNHYNYFPTYTGPGHAAVYTGATPSVNGIVGNDWYDRKLKRTMYVAEDTTVQAVGTEGEVGEMSPANLLSTTITDELKLVSPESSVITVSLKDRGAVLPAGHAGDAAYWYDGLTGNFISSTWYMDELPEWVQDFNETGLSRELNRKTWETLLPIGKYTESNPDDSPYESPMAKGEKPVFPYELKKYAEKTYNIVKATPFGNSLVAEFAKQAVDYEGMGQDTTTDFLGVSFSSTDYVGHQFGPNSIELQDTYLRLDRDLADLMGHLDKKVGKGNYLVFLTSDHGVVEVPQELMDKKLPGGYFNSQPVINSLKTYLGGRYGNGDWVEYFANQQVYLNRDLVEDEEISLTEIQDKTAQFLRKFEGVASTNTASNFAREGYSEGLQEFYQNGFQYNRSGDVYIQLKPGWLNSTSKTGTSHGSPYNYDTHVPLLMYGWHIPNGAATEKTVITQIAPTLSMILNIPLPDGTAAEPLIFH